MMTGVLCYHSFNTTDHDYFSIDPSQLEYQLRTISAFADFVRLEQISAVRQGIKKINKPAIAVTVDDGYADIMSVMPIFTKYRVPVTLFILSDPLHANRAELANNKKLLTTPQIKKLITQGVEIGCHSATHPDFTVLKRADYAKEISRSKQTLEHRLGKEVPYFAYPKGRYTREIVEAVRNAGYKAGFTIFPTRAMINAQYLQSRIIIDSRNVHRPMQLILHPWYQNIRSATRFLNLDRLFIRNES